MTKATDGIYYFFFEKKNLLFGGWGGGLITKNKCIATVDERK